MLRSAVKLTPEIEPISNERLLIRPGVNETMLGSARSLRGRAGVADDGGGIEGTCAIPLGEPLEKRQREISAQELGALLNGIDLS